MRGWSIVMLSSLLCLAAPAAGAACCQLVKVEAQPALTSVRVCDAASGADCAQTLYQGNVGFGSPVSICTDAGGVIYRELDPGTGSYGAATTARCGTGANVEL